jgi:ABC-type dipeptide/oligopeptide/nickel transport system permease component
MLAYLLSRAFQSLLLIAGALILVFFMVRLTGDPVSLMVAREATPEQREAFREAMGLNRPLLVQFGDYLLSAAQGDLGMSLRLRQPNLELILQRLPATLELAIAALVFAVTLAIPLGVMAGMNPGSLVDRLARLLGLAGQTLPNFWLAILLILWFSVQLRWLPSFGRDSLASLVLPAIALGFAGLGQLIRLTRAAVLDLRSADMVRTARSKGLREDRIALKHVLPNVAIPLISIIGIQFTYLLGGSVYIETIFAWPGLGSLLNTAIRDNDFPLIQAITLFFSVFAISIQLLSDVLYGWIDPRVRPA